MGAPLLRLRPNAWYSKPFHHSSFELSNDASYNNHYNTSTFNWLENLVKKDTKLTTIKKNHLVFLDKLFLTLSNAIKWFLLPSMQWHCWLINISSSSFNY
jgi:hypothetical protein